jgi:hypothetical protein
VAGSRRTERLLRAVRRVLDDGEVVEGRVRVWGAVRRPHLPLVVQRRRQYDAVVTDRRLVLVARRIGALEPSDVVLAKRYEAIVLLAERRRPTLLQLELRADADAVLVVEWPGRSRRLGRFVAGALAHPVLLTGD